MKYAQFKAFSKQYKLPTILAGILVLVILGFVVWLLHDIVETHRLDATSVVLVDNPTAEFGSATPVSEFIQNLDGELVDDVLVNTSQLGTTETKFQYYNVKGKKRTKKFAVEIVDTTKPVIYGQAAYTVETGYSGDLTDLIMSGDDADDHPVREIVGKYDIDKAGSYRLEYVVTDASGNVMRQAFTLYVVDPDSSSDSDPDDSTASDDEEEDPSFSIKDALSLYKNGNTAIGIDVSSWQGEIDWKKVRTSGVEFAIIRVGYQAEYGGEYVLDKTFQNNIAGAIAAGLDVGVYYYSCANSLAEAHRQAEWVLTQVGDHSLALGIAFDWEEWSTFNHAGISFYTLQRIADGFLDVVSAAGHQGLIYGSKNYLDRFWQRSAYPAWLAQYYDRPTYSRPFRIWQFTNVGVVPGIDGYVDLDVSYH